MPTLHKAQLLFAAYYGTVLVAAHDLYRQGGEMLESGLKLLDLELRNVQAGQTWAAAKAKEDHAAAQMCIDYALWPAILSLRQHPIEQIQWLEPAVEASRQLKERDAEGRHLSALGIAYACLGETHQAIDLHEQSLKIARTRRSRGRSRCTGQFGI